MTDGSSILTNGQFPWINRVYFCKYMNKITILNIESFNKFSNYVPFIR